MNEEGSILLLVLLVIIIILTLSTSLAVVVGNEIKMTSYNQNRVKAAYNAEAGIEGILNAFYNGSSDLDSIATEIENDNSYDVKNIDVSIISDSDHIRIYEISVTGESGNIEETITVHIAANTLKEKTIAAGGDINKSEGFFGIGGVTINGDYEDNIESNLPEFEFDSDAYVNKDEDGNIIYNDDGEPDVAGKIADYYFPDQTSFENKYCSGFWSNLGTYVDLPPGEIIYVDGDLNIGNIFGFIEGGTEEEPAIVVVNGDLTFTSGFGGIEDVIFIVGSEEDDKGNFKMLEFGAKVDNTFVYTQDNINITAAGFYFSGGLISQEDTNLTAFIGVVDDDPVNLRGTYPILKNNNSYFKPEITRWQE